MIDWLEIHQLVIAEHIGLEFGDSFTTVTGETGSGKSLIVEAISILLGARCDNSLIRPHQETAEIHGSFTLNPAHSARQWLRAHDLDKDDECILRRAIRRDKPSRAYINGRTVTAAQLRSLGRELADIHSQNEHHFLLRRKAQLSVLDHAAEHDELVAQLADHYEKLTSVRERITQLTDHSNLTQERANLLQFQIEELVALAPQPDEWPQLEAKQKQMNHAQDLSVGVHSVVEKLGGSGEGEESNLTTTLTDCCRKIQHLGEYDSRLEKILAMLEEASVNLSEATAQLQALYADSTFSAEQMAEIEERFSLYHNLARKHRTLPGLLAEKLAQMQEELAGLQDPEAELKRLQTQWSELKPEYDKLAEVISKNRTNAAEQLSAKVTELMQELGMAGGVFKTNLQPHDPSNISRHGNESVEFVVSVNPGQPMQALSKAASGGELSRISLAINVVLAAAAPDSTLILDEIDVGIGGKVAEIVGQKLRQIGQYRQVLCITHLAQVAANGHHHLSVIKQTAQQANVTVQSLSREQRIDEIARMSAGAELTPQSRAHAEQLLPSA